MLYKHMDIDIDIKLHAAIQAKKSCNIYSIRNGYSKIQ